MIVRVHVHCSTAQAALATARLASKQATRWRGVAEVWDYRPVYSPSLVTIDRSIVPWQALGISMNSHVTLFQPMTDLESLQRYNNIQIWTGYEGNSTNYYTSTMILNLSLAETVSHDYL